MGSELTIAQNSLSIGHRNLFLRFATPTLLRLCYLAPPLNTIQTLPHCLLVFLLQVTTNRISNSRHCQSDIYRLSYFAPLGIPFKRPLKNPQVLHVVLRVFFQDIYYFRRCPLFLFVTSTCGKRSASNSNKKIQF